jgi:hypothetical protein
MSFASRGKRNLLVLEMFNALEQAKLRLEAAGLNDTTLDVVKDVINKAKGTV